MQWREVFKRRRSEKDISTLFLMDRFDCVATNDFSGQPATIFQYYNGRARIENSIRELKNDYKLGHFAMQWFAVNDVTTQTTILGYVLLQHFKKTLLDEDLQKKPLSSLRWRVFQIPGWAQRGARRRWMRIHNVFLKPEA